MDRMPWREPEPVVIVKQIPQVMIGLRTVYKTDEDGKQVPSQEEYRQTTMATVTEHHKATPQEPPTNIQLVQFWVIVFVAIGFGAYGMLTIGFWVRDKYTRKLESADTRDSQDRMSDLAKLGAGILVGIFGAIDTANPDALGGGDPGVEVQQGTATPAGQGVPENAPSPPPEERPASPQ